MSRRVTNLETAELLARFCDDNAEAVAIREGLEPRDTAPLAAWLAGFLSSRRDEARAQWTWSGPLAQWRAFRDHEIVPATYGPIPHNAPKWLHDERAAVEAARWGGR